MSNLGKKLAVHRLLRGSELIQASEGPLKGVKMTVMDIIRFRDILMRTLPTQISDILSVLNRGAYMPPPGLIRVKRLTIFSSSVTRLSSESVLY